MSQVKVFTIAINLVGYSLIQRKVSIAAYSGLTSAARFTMTFEGVEKVRGITFSLNLSEDQKYLDIARYGLQL